jgi:hypothetical protein
VYVPSEELLLLKLPVTDTKSYIAKENALFVIAQLLKGIEASND